MGQRWKKGAKKRNNGIRRKGPNPRYFDGNHRAEGDQNYTLSWQINRRMEAYYAYQGLHNMYWSDETGSYQPCHTDEQKTDEAIRWMTTIKRILPASFRIGVDVDPIVRQRLEQELEELVGQEMDLLIEASTMTGGDTTITAATSHKIRLAPAKRIPFVPHAYQLAIDRHTIRKNPSLNKLFTWLKIQTEAGFVTRQETVSMIPPIVMDIKPHHHVLDMCAAPGSKTSQILEIVSEIPPGCLEPVGCVVANDADPKRAYMLVHQLKRIPSPAALVTSCDAQFFPLLKHFHKEDPTYEGMFDRVLADVPCTGDGTMRKNPQVWKTWSCLNSLSLHPMQLAIALNGARLTKVGGYLCYSTCAMNPIENEAVVAELLRTTDGALELIDRRVDLPGLKARPGWSHWKVMREEKSNRKAKNEANKRNSKMQARRREFEMKNPVEKDESLVTEAETLAIDETETAVLETDSVIAETVDASEQVATTPKAVPQPLGPPPTWEESILKARCESEGFTEYKSFDDVEENWQRTIRRSTFPPTDEEVRTMQLHKCLRLVSHDMDTNGFFVALFRKVQPLSQRARDKSAKLAAELRKDTGGDPEGKEQPFSPVKKKAKVDVEKDDNGAVVAKDDANTSITSATTKDSDNNPTSMTDITAGEGDIVSTTSKVTMSAPSEGKIVKGKTARGALRGNLGNENFVPVTESNLIPLLSYYGFREDFPQDQIMARGSGDTKVFSFISKAIKKYMDAGIQDRITIINSGLKCFERNNNECDVNYRVGQEGIHFLSPYMINRKFVVTIKDFITCFRHSTTNTANFNTIPISSLSSPLQEKVRALSVGSFLVVLEGYEHDISKKLMMVMWRCRGDNINCLVCKVERDGMRSKIRAITGESLEDDNDDNVHPSSFSPDAQDEEGGDDKGDHDDNLILGEEDEDAS